jgi:hypothetical protein
MNQALYAHMNNKRKKISFNFRTNVSFGKYIQWEEKKLNKS